MNKIVLGAQEEDERFGLFIWIVARLGLRRGEACALRWEDIDSQRGLVHVRRAIARRKGGTYLKVPKSGEERSLRMSPAFFEHLEPFRKPKGWLFPRAYNSPYLQAGVVAAHSTAGRLLAWLASNEGAVRCARGGAGVMAARAVGLGLRSAAPMLRRLESEGYIERDANPSRIYAISLTEKGQDSVDLWSDTEVSDGVPWFPNTPDQRFTQLMRRLEMPYTLHSLRHFVATHLYNRVRDWVQLARFLGHTNPSITMGLYANHVVETSQIALGEVAMNLFEDSILR